MSKKHFEANMLDEDEIQQGQMLSSESVWEYIQEYYIKKEEVIKAQIETLETIGKIFKTLSGDK